MFETYATADKAQDQNLPIDAEDEIHRRDAGATPEAGATPDTDEIDDLDQLLTQLTTEQKNFVSQHIGLVGLHIRNNVPTPHQPQRKREYEDLFQEGCLALIKAAIRYDQTKDGEFPAYALPRIRGAVYKALYDKFSIIHVPFRVMIKLQQSPNDGPLDPLCRPILNLNNNLPIEVPIEACFDQKNETVRHMIRRRFELAVRNTITDIKSQKWRRLDTAQIMQQIANERLLIVRESNKTAQRRIALNFGLSSSRASSYERRLIGRIKQIFQNDLQVRMLIRFANEDPDGFNTVLDDRQYEQLSRAEVDQFIQRFEQMKKSARAQLLYSLIERSADNVTEVARNLYLLTLPANLN